MQYGIRDCMPTKQYGAGCAVFQIPRFGIDANVVGLGAIRSVH